MVGQTKSLILFGCRQTARVCGDRTIVDLRHRHSDQSLTRGARSRCLRFAPSGRPAGRQVKREAKVCKHCGSALPPLVIEVELQEARAARLKVQDRQAIFGSVIAIIAIIGLFVSFAVALRRAVPRF
jgi:hypothetical protein